MDFFTDDDVASMRSDLTDLITDESIASNILYRHLTSNAFDPITGRNAQTFVEYTFKACGSAFTIFEIARSNGLLRVGDTLFTMLASDVNKLMQIGDLFYVQVTDDGEVNITKDSTLIEGIESTFLSDGVQPYDIIVVNGEYGVIKAITADDSAELQDAWAGDNWIETPYAIYRQYSIIQIVQDLLGITVRISVRRSGGITNG